MNNTYYKILNEIAAVFNMDQWDEQVDLFTDVINEQLNPFVHNTKCDYIYILENHATSSQPSSYNFPQYNFYAERCYINRKKVELESNGKTKNKWKNQETVDVIIEDLDQLGESCKCMFYGCYSLISVPKFDTSGVKNMKFMFTQCLSLESVPKFDTSRVTDMECMFWECRSLIAVPEFDTSMVTNMRCMFEVCPSLESVPKFNINRVGANIWKMFFRCDSLSEKTIQDWSSVYNFETDKMK